MAHVIFTMLLLAATASVGAAQRPYTVRDRAPIPLHPSALAQLIDELGGQVVSFPQAKVISVLGPRAFLVESASSLSPTPGSYHRVIVLVADGSLRAGPESLVGAVVQVTGVARTILGMQTTREVPWPPELTRDVVRRYEIRAAVLSSSVKTPDGVQLVAVSSTNDAE